MPNHVPVELTIFLADVAGSVELYEALGDIRAHNLVVECLQLMARAAEHNNGKVVETVGDEIMCAFKCPDAAMNTAFEIQQGLGDREASSINVRIGLHSGKTFLQEEHPYGDTVNIAARMVALAKAGQIIFSQQTFDRLSSSNQASSRYFDEVFIKGKRVPYKIYEFLGAHTEATVIATPNTGNTTPERRRNIKCIRISYDKEERDLTPADTEFLLGRGKQCGLIVTSKAASRLHAIFSWKGGQVILYDRSTNGTYVFTRAGKRRTDGQEIFIRHREWNMEGSGIISLGEPITEEGKNLIRFTCQY